MSLLLAWGNPSKGGPVCTPAGCEQEPSPVPCSHTLTKLDAGNDFNLAITADSKVQAWGQNSRGELGDGTVTPSPDALVSVSKLTGVTATASGNRNAVALLASGTVEAWGRGSGKSPAAVPNLSGVTAVAAGAETCLALLANGTVMTWGLSLLQAVPGLTGATAISVGCGFAGALLADGTVQAWGVNTFGQLGNGTTVDSATPVAVSSLTGVQEISFGGNNVDDGHVLALLDDGTVVAWGCNASGQLGDTTTTDSSVPVTVAGLSGIVAVAAGGSHSMALDNTGTLWTWGDNTYGQLGDSSTVDSSAPIDVLADVTLFSAGSEHSIAYQTG